MAFQLITPTPTIQLFDSIPVMPDENNIYPRGRVVYNGNAQVSASGAEINTLRLDFELPQGFAYAMDKIVVWLLDSDSQELVSWDNVGILSFFTRDPGFVSFVQELGSSSPVPYDIDQAGLSRVYQPVGRANGAQRNVFGDKNDGSPPTVRAELFDTSELATGLMTVIWSAEFLQYSVRQAHMVTVNAPAPVTNR